MVGSILLIDTDVDVLRACGGVLEETGYEVLRELSAEAALETYDRLEPDVVLLDWHFDGERGPRLLDQLVARGATIVLTTEPDSAAGAVHGLDQGAVGRLVKPVSAPELLALTARAADYTRVRRLEGACADKMRPLGGLEALGTSSAMKKLAHEIKVLGKNDNTTVLLKGERGTETRLVARLIHDSSPRVSAPFVAVRCSGRSATELDSELFGHEKGAHPTAVSRRRGWFELVGAGTILLEGIEALAPVLQPKLLRVLETKTFRRLGGTRDVTADVRLIASTSHDLGPAVDAGNFRKDLYYRLSVMELPIPPVRRRSPEDRSKLFAHFLAAARERYAEGPTEASEEALARLQEYEWRGGNTMEVANVMDRALLLAIERGHEIVEVGDLAGELRARAGFGDRRHTPMTLDELEKIQMERTLRSHAGNRTRSARELGISRATLINKIKRYNINV
ncbi:MAG: sigma-54-dependent Fis family transcriptional regulator [Gemmatimonadales bacterium]|nr:MAG: sigma-54-dependent Fis family transcriptional regulator [Gemmatimonadales bacterium]